MIPLYPGLLFFVAHPSVIDSVKCCNVLWCSEVFPLNLRFPVITRDSSDCDSITGYINVVQAFLAVRLSVLKGTVEIVDECLTLEPWKRGPFSIILFYISCMHYVSSCDKGQLLAQLRLRGA